MPILIDTLADFRPHIVKVGSPEPSIRMLLEDYYTRLLPDVTQAEVKAGVKAYLSTLKTYMRGTYELR